LNKLGPEPLSDEFTIDVWLSRFSQRKGKVKALLLNQSFVAGVGNIYADELLFLAKVHPERTAESLKKKEMTALYHALREILQEAVDQGGSTVKSYVNGQGEMGYFQQQLKVYARQGQPCLDCGTEIMKSVVAGRGTHVCPKCQTLPKTIK
jgi:formamidopyrimidine-DNA glycosylase